MDRAEHVGPEGIWETSEPMFKFPVNLKLLFGFEIQLSGRVLA